ncbi:MAG TPA: DUF5700 domain-containing putative Zn-dependent protease [Gemmatimonadaceae bacterium]|nr:DUF5700 domain-containing putative Zn-dependent protease [Gemmatimonadaceae bacterium]
MSRTPALLVVIIMAALAGTAAAQTTPIIDVSGLDQFWRIESVLAQGGEPADSVWDAMWATPGYAMLESREGRRRLLTTAMRLALNPARARAADSAIARNGWLAMVIPHLRLVASRRDTLRLIERSLGSPEIFATGIRRAQEFLPSGTTSRLRVPDVSLIYFLDARGYQRILFDPSHLMDLYDPTLVLGHEMHHYYGNQLAPDSRPFGEDMIAWRVATTETEGVAGLVDKREVPRLTKAQLAVRYRDSRARQYFDDYQEDYKRSNQWLAWFDDILRRKAAHPDSAMILGKTLDATLPDNGRIMGAFMAEVIEEHLGHAMLVDHIADPWAFWRNYNEAARRSAGKAFVLSDSAMGAIADIEREYRKPEKRHSSGATSGPRGPGSPVQ